MTLFYTKKADLLTLVSEDVFTDNSFMGEFFGEQWEDEYERAERLTEASRLLELDAAVHRDPERDYFSEARPLKPKRAVGEYVAAHGFSVPLIHDHAEWTTAVDANQAMIRSERRQDYEGFSGLLASQIIGPDARLSPLLFSSSADFNEALGGLLVTGLRSGQLSAADYMRHFVWPIYEENLSQQLSELRIGNIDFGYADVSLWRYVEGTNIRVFRDPTVEGRYHFGITPDEGYVLGYQFDQVDHDKIIDQESSSQPIQVRQVIDYYEAIRTLPRFDQRQAPLMELKLDNGGQLHFLQYLKTGQLIKPVDEFSLPAGNNLIRSDDVRGATNPSGEQIKIYIDPERVTKEMKNQAFFIEGNHFAGFREQYFSMIGRMIIHKEYISMKNNHFDSAPLYRPAVAIGLWSAGSGSENRTKFSELQAIAHGRTVYDRGIYGAAYIDARITANGRQATIETDWQLKTEPYY